jgi:D-alanyl-D-alanine dipeptidase
MLCCARLFFSVLLSVVIVLPKANPSVAQDHPEAFVDVSDIVPDLIIDMRYFSSHNFVGKQIDGYETPVCYLTKQAGKALAQAASEALSLGYALKVFDCYRPARAVAHFVRWARDLEDIATKAEFYPSVEKKHLFRDGYIASRSGHSRGSTVDVTLVRGFDGQEVDMGTSYDFFSTKSWPSDRSVSVEAQKSRELLGELMRRNGFDAYDKEWWHFTLRHEPFPDTYFDFVVR